jgi:hypothetical protein
VHEHFDADGNATGHTVITRESEWDDQSRGRALRLAEYEDSICACGCGQPIEVAYDKTRAFVVDEFTCQAGRALDKVRREKREDAEKRKAPAGWDDGLHMIARPHDPDRDKPLKQQKPKGAQP